MACGIYTTHSLTHALTSTCTCTCTCTCIPHAVTHALASTCTCTCTCTYIPHAVAHALASTCTCIPHATTRYIHSDKQVQSPHTSHTNHQHNRKHLHPLVHSEPLSLHYHCIGHHTLPAFFLSIFWQLEGIWRSSKVFKWLSILSAYSLAYASSSGERRELPLSRDASASKI